MKQFLTALLVAVLAIPVHSIERIFVPPIDPDEGTAHVASTICVGEDPCVVPVDAVFVSSGSGVFQSSSTEAGVPILRIKAANGDELIRFQQDGHVGFNDATATEQFTITALDAGFQNIFRVNDEGGGVVFNVAKHTNDDGLVNIYNNASVSFMQFYSGGNSNIDGPAGFAFIINEQSLDYDFRVESNADTHALFLESSTGDLGIGESSPEGKLTVNQNAGEDDIILSLKNSDVNQPTTDEAEADTYFTVRKIDDDGGGAEITGLSDAGGSDDSALTFRGIKGATVDINDAAINFICGKNNGTGAGDLASNDKCLTFMSPMGVGYLQIDADRNIGISDSSPDARLTIRHTAGENTKILSLKDFVASTHGVTTVAETDTYGFFRTIDPDDAGLLIVGLNDGSTGNDFTALSLHGIQSSDPTDTDPAVNIKCSKSDGGTGEASLASAETCFSVTDAVTGDSLLTVRADGNTLIGGAFRLTSKTIAELELLTPLQGDRYECSDCTNSVNTVIGTTTLSGFDSVGVGGTAWH